MEKRGIKAQWYEILSEIAEIAGFFQILVHVYTQGTPPPLVDKRGLLADPFGQSYFQGF